MNSVMVSSERMERRSSSECAPPSAPSAVETSSAHAVRLHAPGAELGVIRGAGQHGRDRGSAEHAAAHGFQRAVHLRVQARGRRGGAAWSASGIASTPVSPMTRRSSARNRADFRRAAPHIEVRFGLRGNHVDAESAFHHGGHHRGAQDGVVPGIVQPELAVDLAARGPGPECRGNAPPRAGGLMAARRSK